MRGDAGSCTSTYTPAYTHTCMCACTPRPALHHHLPFQASFRHSGHKPWGAAGVWIWSVLGTHSAHPAGHGSLYGGGVIAGGPTQSTPSTYCSIEPSDLSPGTPGLQQLRPASEAHLRLATPNAEFRHGLVTPAINKGPGERLFALTTWPVSSPQLACRSSRCSEGLLESQGTAGLGVLILIMLKASQKNPKP